MPDYYVMVYKFDSGRPIEPELCGHLYSISKAKADKEAREYSEMLNGGWPLEVLMGQYLTVTAVPKGSARAMRGFSRFKNRRVTDKAKWST